MGLYDAYLDSPSWMRATLAVVVLGAGVTMSALGGVHQTYFEDVTSPTGETERELRLGWESAPLLMRLGFLFCGIGTLLLVTSGKSRSERNGYNF